MIAGPVSAVCVPQTHKPSLSTGHTPAKPKVGDVLRKSRPVSLKTEPPKPNKVRDAALAQRKDGDRTTEFSVMGMGILREKKDMYREKVKREK